MVENPMSVKMVINQRVEIKVVKNDRMDALNITKDLASGSYKAVYVPYEKDVEIKEYIRMVHDLKKSLTIHFIMKYVYKQMTSCQT